MWSQLCLTPSPPRSFLPSSSLMAMQYQGSNQSMDDPPQNQEHDDIVDPAPYFAGDSALLQQQQQLRKNWSEASSDWRPRGGGSFEESNKGFEEESEETMTCLNFLPSPTDFPLYLPLPSSSNSTAFLSDLCNRFEQNVSMVLSDVGNNSALDWLKEPEQDLLLHIFNDNSCVLDAINGLELQHEGLFDRQIEGITSYIDNNVNDLDRIIGAVGMTPEQHDVVLLVQNILQKDMDEMEEVTLRRMNWFEQLDVDIVDPPVLEMVGSVQQLIQKRGGELDLIPGGGVCTINGLEHSDGQGLPMTTEPSFISQSKFSVRVWLGYGGQWVAEVRFRHRLNYHNIGGFTTMDDATLAYEMVMRWSGWMDLTGFPRLFEKANRSKLPLQLPPPAQEEKLDEGFGLVHSNARGNDEIEVVGTGSEGTWDCVMAHQARLNLGKRKTQEKNLGEERRNKKTNGVRIAIPLEDILQTKGLGLKDAANHLEVSIPELESSCRDYGIQSWPPRNEHKLNRQSLPSETLAVVNQEGFPQLSSHTMPSNQALTVTVDTNTFSKTEIPSPQFLPTARQENPNAGFGNDEDEAIGMEVEGTGEGVMVEAQFNSSYLGKGKWKWKEKSPGGERGNNNTTGVRIAVPKEDILHTKGMHLKDTAKHLEGGRSTLEQNLISCPNETPNVVDQEGIPQLNYDTLPSDQALAATVGTNSVVVKDIPQPQFSLTDRQDNPDDDFGKDEVEAVGMVGEGTGEGKMEEGQLNSGCLGKGKRKEETSGGDTRKKKTNGVKIAISLDNILQAEGMLLEDAAKKLKDEYFCNVEAEAVGMGSGGTGQSDMEEGQLNSRYLGKEKRKEMIPGGERRNKKNAISLEDILQCKEMPQKVAAMHLKVGLSTLKRACRGHGIPSWPPCVEHNQSRPNESPAVVDKEPIPQLNSDTLLPSNQVSATIGTGSVTVKASFGTVKMKFQLSCPWRMVELKQEVDKRLEHEAGNYHITYKDEDNDYILIACDEDLQGHISRSSLPGTNSIEVFLKPK